jgi:DNA-binding transcriptional ArsR family regulator
MEQLDLIPLWKALADTKRRRIIRLLHKSTRTTSEISDYFDVSRFAIMRHLKVLEQAGLIKTRREGRQRWNFLNEELFQQIQRTYLENGPDGQYQLGDILGFLAREEERPARETVSSSQHPIELEIELQARQERVFQTLTDDIDSWWSYRFSTDSHMHLEPWVGGRFYEAFDNGGGALYAFVTYLKPGEEIRLNGSMGLADEDNNNIIHFVLQNQQPDMTHLRFTHRFLGKANMITVDIFKRSWVKLLTQHLKSFIEEDSCDRDAFSVGNRH